MPRNDTLIAPQELTEAELLVKSLITQYGLDFVLKICALASIDREASHRAVQEFTGKEQP